jgi:hypothetical protein
MPRLNLATVEYALKSGITYVEARERRAHFRAHAPLGPNLAHHGVKLPDPDQLASYRKDFGREMVLRYDRLPRYADFQHNRAVVGDDECIHAARVAGALGHPVTYEMVIDLFRRLAGR